MNVDLIKGALAASLLATCGVAQADLAEYNQDFEGLDKNSPSALSDDGWTVFGNVSDLNGNFLFGYGPFGAPNGGSAFSAIVDDQGGPDQGTQQMSVYNDYNCCGLGGPSPAGHGNGTDLVESNVFQEQSIGAADVGSQWTFSFQAKAGNIGGGTTALAFIKTLDPNAGFATTNLITVDMTNVGNDWTGESLSIAIDPSLAGQLLQIGFLSVASNFEPSGVIYDNINFAADAAPDADGDGVADNADNCTLIANSGQQDTNGDGFGNACDPDLDGSCSVNFADLNLLKQVIFSADADADFDSSGFVNFNDLQIMKSFIFGQPGPSALASCPPPS